MKAFYGISALLALVLALFGGCWWTISRMHDWATVVAPFIADNARLWGSLLAGWFFFYVAGAVTVLLKVMEGRMTRAAIPGLGMGLAGLLLGFCWFVLVVAGGGMDQHGVVWLCLGAVFGFVIGLAYVVASLMTLAFAAWYAAADYLRAQRQLVLSRE